MYEGFFGPLGAFVMFTIRCVIHTLLGKKGLSESLLIWLELRPVPEQAARPWCR